MKKKGKKNSVNRSLGELVVRYTVVIINIADGDEMFARFLPLDEAKALATRLSAKKDIICKVWESDKLIAEYIGGKERRGGL